MSFETRLVCDFHYCRECVGYVQDIEERNLDKEVLEIFDFEKRPNGKHICPICRDWEKKQLKDW